LCSFCYFNFFLLFYLCGEIFLHPIDHVYIALILIIKLEIVLKWDNFLTIIMSIWTQSLDRVMTSTLIPITQQSNFSRQWLKGKGVYEVIGNNGVQIQMASLERKLDILVKVMTTHNISLIQQIGQVEVCAICSHSYHTTETCPMSSFIDQEQANYVSQNNYPPKNNPYSITYNTRWRNHPNFSWTNNQNMHNPQGQQRNF
jgi:hypothetical protein